MQSVAHLGKNSQFGLSNLTLVKQDSTSVFTKDGHLVFWEDGEDLRAPNGMAGCLKALLESSWFEEQVKRGHEFIYVWYANDLTAGQHLSMHLERFAAGGSECAWLSDPKGMELIGRVSKATNPTARGQLIHALEDSCGAYILHHQMASKLLIDVDPHVVERELPIVLQDGDFLSEYKREIFLCDPFWKRQAGLATPMPAMIGRTATVPEDFTLTSPPTRAQQFFARFGRKQLLQSLESGGEMEIPRDLGIKKIGDNLVDDWRIESIIDEGGMSTVYVCRSELNRERVAVKTYKQNDRWMKPGVRAQFKKEGLAWIALAPHPHLIEALSAREIDGAVHIFMEYAEGGCLRHRLNHGPLPVLTAVQIGIQVCDALQAIHNGGLLHKDVKPANVLFDASGHAKLSDLGVAAAFHGEDLSEVAGTLPYIAPEFHARANVTNTADIYSLGVMLYEMLAG